jgi:hemerythrin superfamily protein
MTARNVAIAGSPAVTDRGCSAVMEAFLHTYQWGVPTKPVPERNMNAIELLTKDHQQVQQLFSDFLSSDEEDFAQREDLFQEIEKLVLAHSEAEEEILYPAVEPHAAGLIQRSISEHQEVKQLLTEMLSYEVDDDEFETRMQTLMQKFQTHVQEEEGSGGTFEVARQNFSEDELDDMGRRIQKREKDFEDELAA